MPDPIDALTARLRALLGQEPAVTPPRTLPGRSGRATITVVPGTNPDVPNATHADYRSQEARGDAGPILPGPTVRPPPPAEAPPGQPADMTFTQPAKAPLPHGQPGIVRQVPYVSLGSIVRDLLHSYGLRGRPSARSRALRSGPKLLPSTPQMVEVPPGR